MGKKIKRKLSAIVGVLLLSVMATQTRAATITVTNTNDSGAGSLRQALAEVSDGDTINFTVNGTITLTSGVLTVDEDVTISGPGANQLSIDGTHQFGLATVAGNTIAISGLTIINGGVGISNDGATLTVTNCVVSESSDAGLSNNSFYDTALLTIVNSIISDNSGSGVVNTTFRGQSNLVIVNCTISGNSTKDKGGGISSSLNPDGEGSISVTNCRVIGNSADLGGGIACDQLGGLSIVNSTISGNSAGSSGGGLWISPGSLVSGGPITNSTISGNSAGTSGGGISNSGALQISNSTVSGNSAASSGGGISNDGPMQISNSTISNNSAEPADGIYNGIDGQLQISNTILNAGAFGENIFNDGGTVTSNGYNLSSDDGGGYLNGPGDQVNTDPVLGPLRDNHGPTLTHAPLPNSPAIDAGDPGFTPPPSVDQRGFVRVVNHRIDIGSVEAQPRRPTPIPRSTPPR
jgi:hypothetical protein